ncbi:putative nuclease HARBI1 isoform X2 [Bacillus rossius redtenbacheri]
MLPSTYEHVLTLIGPAITSSSAFVGRKTIEADKQLKLTLYYLASPNSYRSMCEMFGVGRATIVRTLKRVTYALHCLAPQWIKWPKGDEAVRVCREFEAVCGFPRVIGAIAGTQVNVPAPREDACSIVNRKNDYSIHLQVVCDARGVFTHCVAGDTASLLETSARGASPLARRLADPGEHFPGGAHLVGDAAYGLQAHLQVPFGRGAAATELQRNYDRCLALGARPAEVALGTLRGRFRGLQDTLPVADTRKIPELVMACCVLHNVCALAGDRLDDEDYAAATLAHAPVHAGAGARATGELLRESIMERLPLKPEQGAA